MIILQFDESQNTEYKESWNANTLNGSAALLMRKAATNDTGSREMFMKGIDYSYYYEQED